MEKTQKLESILIVDDEPDARNLLTKVLEKEGYEARAVETGEKALSEVKCGRFAAVLLDYRLPGASGIEILKLLLSEDPDLRVILITSHGSIKLAVEAIQLGAYNFLPKPFDLDEVRIAVSRAVENYRIRRENQQLSETVRLKGHSEYLLGKNAAMQAVWKVVKKIASSDVPVLIEGESGTGKEIVAKAVHQESLRSKGPFVPLNCATLSRELIESELFGHAKGSFTGAISHHKGRFEVADGGTLFLDEIGELPLELQPKLLRVLQEKTFERVGDTTPRRVNVRIIAATNRNLEEEVRHQRFREDLFFRLNVVNMKLPPLRERRDDLKDFIEFFIGRFSVQLGKKSLNLDMAAADYLMQYDFPGNIRELANMLERASLLCTQDMIGLADLAPGMPKVAKPPLEDKASQTSVTNFAEAKSQFEIAHIMRLLALARGNVSQAARLAGLDRNNFKDKMRKYGIESTEFKE